tara:strand:+ start:62 stop:385 length:324 start_codon:yes stop_codon:yes gene_type:complete
MDIENCNNPLNIYQTSSNKSELHINDLIDKLEDCCFNDTYTIYISKMLNKLKEDMSYVTFYDRDISQYRLDIKVPEWFNTLDIKIQNKLMKLIEPYLEHLFIECNKN